MNVHVSRCVSHFVQLLEHVVSLTEIYECRFSAQLDIVKVDGGHGQYICWFEKCTDAVPHSVYWHNACILYENSNIDLNTSPSLQSICSLKNAAVPINLLEYVPSMEMC